MEKLPENVSLGVTDQLLVEQKVLLPVISEALAKLQLQSPRIFDAGCGDGRFGEWLIEKIPGAKLSVCEIDDNELAVAKNKLGPAVDARHVNIARGLPYENGSFDLVTLLNVLMWLPDDDFKRAVADVGRVLAPGASAISVGVHSDWMDIRYLPVHLGARPSYLVTASWNNKPVTIWRRQMARYLELFESEGFVVKPQEIAIPTGTDLPVRYAEKAGTNLYAMFTITKRA